MASLDLKDVYFHIPIWPAHRRFLRITVNMRGKLTHFQFRVLPFGITSARFVFTNVISSVVSVLTLQGIKIILYLDDWLIMASTTLLLKEQVSITLSLLTEFGWIINQEKSNLTPATTKQFLGFVIDSQEMKLYPPTQERTVFKGGFGTESPDPSDKCIEMPYPSLWCNPEKQIQHLFFLACADRKNLSILPEHSGTDLALMHFNGKKCSGILDGDKTAACCNIISVLKRQKD